MAVLGLESSCDETAAAVCADGKIVAQTVFSQIDAHRLYRGVVPEIAARAHLEKADVIVRETMRQAGLEFQNLKGVAVTAGPGLIGGLIVGVMTAKAICLAHGLPLVAVNHLEGHALSSLIASSAPFPYLLLLASGGHCQILEVQGVGSYRLLGGTLDDALGETFDKVAALIDLPYPGGPSVERLACDGNPNAFIFPRPLCRTRGCDFSFSGLKTAVRLAVEKQSRPMSDRIRADICASFQAAAIDCLSDRLEQALKIGAGQSLVVAGGVAANRAVRAALESLAARHGRPFYAPPLGLCTDNGAMIAYAGERRLRLGLVDGLDVKPRPRWELESLNGRKGS